jgi:hypothetical protein
MACNYAKVQSQLPDKTFFFFFFFFSFFFSTFEDLINQLIRFCIDKILNPCDILIHFRLNYFFFPETSNKLYNSANDRGPIMHVIEI